MNLCPRRCSQRLKHPNSVNRAACAGDADDVRSHFLDDDVNEHFNIGIETVRRASRARYSEARPTASQQLCLAPRTRQHVAAAAAAALDGKKMIDARQSYFVHFALKLGPAAAWQSVLVEPRMDHFMQQRRLNLLLMSCEQHRGQLDHGSAVTDAACHRR